MLSEVGAFQMLNSLISKFYDCQEKFPNNELPNDQRIHVLLIVITSKYLNKIEI